MKINYFTVIFWFNIFENHQEILEDLKEEMQSDLPEFEVYDTGDNLVNPVIVAFNKDTKSEIVFSKINLQFSIDQLPFKKMSVFKEKALQIFDFLTEHDIDILHTTVIVNGETVNSKALERVTENTLVPTLISEDLIDVTLKIGKKHEDLFYKVITILNKKQLNLPKKVDKSGFYIPIPLISWHNAEVAAELVEITYEINDKYLFDSTNNYHTTTFYLNKLLYVLETDFENDVNNLLDRGQL